MDAMRRFLILALVLGLQLPAGAGVLYKSVDKQGRITFSDVPIEGAVMTQRIESSESAKGAVGNENAPILLALADVTNEAVARANMRVDMAERALAQARREIYGDFDPLALHAPRRDANDLQRLEFHKRDLNDARRTLMRALQQRNALAPRPVA